MTASSASPASFLSLPFSIRREIYILAGLSRRCPIALVPEQRVPTPRPHVPVCGFVRVRRRSGRVCRYQKLLLGNWAAHYQSEQDCFCPKIPIQLLLVSKTVYHEVHAIFYRENGFILRAHQAEDLAVLKTLSSQSIHEMTCLMLRLNSWPCRSGHDLADLPHGQCLCCKTYASMADPALCSGNSESEKMVQSWVGTCKILGSSITADRLSLTFICDVADVEMAKRIVRPLEEIPRLKSCVIRLGRTRDDKLRSLARTTSLKLTTVSKVAEEACSRILFEKLPREIRLRILEFTNLGKYGTFSKKQAPWARDYTNLLIERGTLIQRVGPRSIVNKMCCSSCNFTKKDCCCPLRFAAFSPSCQCRVLPLELMLVSRQMDTDASEILYATNTFVFADSFESTLSFLKSLRPSTLKLFRHITFTLDSLQTRKWGAQEEAWTALIQFIHDSFYVSKLTITIDSDGDRGTAMWDDWDEDTVDAVREAYIKQTRLIKNLLPGLRGYHLHIPFDSELGLTLEGDVMGPA